MEDREQKLLDRRVSRRDAIKAGGIAALGLAFAKPVIETIYPKPIFATGGTGMPCAGSVRLENQTVEVTAGDEATARAAAKQILDQQLENLLPVCAGSCLPGQVCVVDRRLESSGCESLDNNLWSCTVELVTRECICTTPGEF